MIYRIERTWVNPVYSTQAKGRVKIVLKGGIYLFVDLETEKMSMEWRAYEYQVHPSRFYDIEKETEYMVVAFPAPLAKGLVGFMIEPDDLYLES
jgi:hypothetical protein